MIGCHVRVEEVGTALEMFSAMRCRGVDVNATTVVALAACGWRGESLHGFCIKTGLFTDVKVATALQGMYFRKVGTGCAKKIFDEVMRRDVVLYNCMVDNCAKGGKVEEAMGLVDRMRQEGVRPNTGTLVTVLSACGTSGAIAAGCRIHDLALELGLELDTALGTALMDMYFKCGYPNEAHVVFYAMRDRDVMTWTAIIMGLGVNGQSDAALSQFRAMARDGVAPNEVTFLAVLNACSHGGLVSEGKKHLESMVRQYGISPRSEHYGCIIDLLGRAGRLEEAYDLMRNLSSHGDAMAWRALLAACRVHGNIELGRMVQAQLDAMGDYHPSDTILLSNVYASEDRWDEIAHVRDSGQKLVMYKKQAGCSSIEVSF